MFMMCVTSQRCIVISILLIWSNTTVIQDTNKIQQYFSSEQQPTLWHIILAIEDLQTAWEDKRDDPHFEVYADTVQDGLNKLTKYYLAFDQTPAVLLTLSKISISSITIN